MCCLCYWDCFCDFNLLQGLEKVGVDPPKGTIIPLFDPPAGFSPGDIAILHVFRLTQRMVTATIVSLAIKGHIKISYLKRNIVWKGFQRIPVL